MIITSAIQITVITLTGIVGITVRIVQMLILFLKVATTQEKS